MTDTRAFRGAAPGGNIARGAAVTQPAMTRAQAGIGGPFTKRASAKGDSNKPAIDDDDQDDEKPKKAAKKDEESLFGKDVSKGSAGSAGDFKSMPGSLADAFDDNDDKGENPAPNSTGEPKTPSGF